MKRYSTTVVALRAMCALSPLCTWPHLLSWKTGSFPVPEIFISPSLFHTCTDVYVCFLWGLVWCRGRILFLLPWFWWVFFPPPFVFPSLCHTVLLPYELSFPLTSLSTSLAKEANVYFKQCVMQQPPPHRQRREGWQNACSEEVSTLFYSLQKQHMPQTNHQLCN